MQAVSPCPRYNNSESDFLKQLKPHFPNKLNPAWVPQLRAVQNSVSVKTARYIQQFIKKDGIFSKLPRDIQCLIARYLTSIEVGSLQRGCHDFVEMLQWAKIVGPKHKRGALGFSVWDATGANPQDLWRFSFGEENDIANIYRWREMTRLQNLSLTICSSLVPVNFEKFLNHFSLRKLRCYRIDLSPSVMYAFATVASFTSLEVLKLKSSLNENMVSTIIASPYLTKLKKLDLRSCHLSETALFNKLTNLFNLQSLNLAKNFFGRGLLLDFNRITHLTALTELNLSSNRMQTPVPDLPFSLLSNITTLQKLTLDNLWDSDLDALSVLTSLTNLKIGLSYYRNEFSKEFFQVHFPRLKSLSLHSFMCVIKEPSLRLPLFAGLRDLKFNNTRISSCDLQTILGQISCLTKLSLNNSISRGEVSTLCFLNNFTNLTSLKLSDNHLNDDVLNELAQTTNLCGLRRLVLAKNHITAPELLAGHHFPHLQSLNFVANPIGKDKWISFRQAVHFEFLTFLEPNTN